jgi:DNA-binding GntR family transcriptional regulator
MQIKLHEEAVAHVRTMLLDGEIPPGARIPEPELCELLNFAHATA